MLLSKVRTHLPVYIHWSVGWPEKSGRNLQHKYILHLLFSSADTTKTEPESDPLGSIHFFENPLLVAGDSVDFSPGIHLA